ncbi:MAG: DUF3592 domain-containing protein [Limisphaerales bacterium]
MPIEGRLIAGTVALGIGGLFGGIGAYLFRRTYIMTTKWNVARGTVVGFKEEWGPKAGTTYRREVEFQAPSGEKVVFTESTGFGGAAPSSGRKVKVRYSPDDPEQAEIPTIVASWIFPLALLSVGAFCLIVSVMFYAVVP